MFIFKILIMISILELSIFSKDMVKTQSHDLINLDSTINDFVKLDSKIDEILINKNNVSPDELAQIKKDIEQINIKQINTLTNIKVSKENREKFKFMKLYSYKIQKKLIRFKKSFSQTYRLSPSSYTNSKSKKDLISVNREKNEVQIQIDDISKLTKKLVSSSKWLYNISR